MPAISCGKTRGSGAHSHFSVSVSAFKDCTLVTSGLSIRNNSFISHFIRSMDEIKIAAARLRSNQKKKNQKSSMSSASDGCEASN